MEPLMHAASATSDGDAELSFEALTFGGGNESRHSSPELEDSPRGNKYKKKLHKKSSPHADERDKGSAAVYISSVGDHKIDVQTLLKKLESFGVVKAYYFKEKQDFGFVQFLDPMVVDVVVETLNKNGLDGFPLSVERANGKSNSSALSFGGTPFSPSTPSLFSPSMQMLGTPTTPTHPVSPVAEKPDTILVLKNLPFSLKQDQLQEILMQMNTNAPQSINLHFDNAGVFKGMAFIKYRGIEDAIKVFDALNGYDVGGRKVRVEYKRKNKGQQSDIPQEWIDEEDLRKLWDQIKDFSNSSNMTEISFAPTMSNNHKKHVHAMAEKLKLTHHSNGDQNSICIRKASSPVVQSLGTPTHSNGLNGHGLNGHGLNGHGLSGHNHSHNSNLIPNINIVNGGHSHTDNARGINIKSRGRTNSDTVRVGSPAAAGSLSDRDFRSPRGSSFSNKQTVGLSPADSSSDWRGANATSPANTPTQGGVVIAPCRQPKGPDGSKGFGETYRAARAGKPIQV